MNAELVRVEQTSHALDHPTPSAAGFLPTQDEYRFMMMAAEHLADTDFVPKAVRGNKAAVLAQMLTGREMGIGPMRALRQINVIDGKPSPEPELLMARALDAGHFIRVAITTKERCVVRARRHDWPDDEPTFELEWTLDDAVQADLVELKNGKPWAKSKHGKPLPWMTYTRAMLRSRCVGEVCRAVFPDITEGASYAPEELTQGHVYDPHAGAKTLDETPEPLRGEVVQAMQLPDESDPQPQTAWSGGPIADPGPNAVPDPDHKAAVEKVEDTATDFVSAGWLTSDQFTELVNYAERHPDHPAKAMARLEKIAEEKSAEKAERVEEPVQGELVDDQ